MFDGYDAHPSFTPVSQGLENTARVLHYANSCHAQQGSVLVILLQGSLLVQPTNNLFKMMYLLLCDFKKTLKLSWVGLLKASLASL